MLEEILCKENIEAALNKLSEKKDSAGADGMYLSELKTYLELNGELLFEQLKTCKYEPGIVEEVEILDYRGKKRTISKLTSLDRFVLRLIYQEMYKHVQPMFADESYAYQENKGILLAVKKIREYIENGMSYVVEVDVEGFFDNINHNLMIRDLRDLIDDECLCTLIEKFLRCKIRQECELVSKRKGLVQGSPLSPLLSNIYLHNLDLELKKSGLKFVRFADDIKIFCSSYEAGVEILKNVSSFMELQLDLNINKGKSGIYKSINRIYLGYDVIKGKSGYDIRKHQRERKAIYKNWHTSAIDYIDGKYHILQDGILNKKDYSILFENEENKRYLPIEMTEAINVYSSISFSSGFFEMAGQRRIRIEMFNKVGKHVGCFVPDTFVKSAKTMLQQAAMYNNDEQRLKVAKKIEMAALHNMNANLKYYQKKKKSAVLEKTTEIIKGNIIEMNECKDIAGLMLVEARARAAYFNCFNEILGDDGFVFTKRTKRPPQDPLNALISFGNTVMYSRIATEIAKTNLDVRISFIHSANKRAENLNLDLAEIFKPIIVDRVIFTLINKKMIDENEHFERRGNMVYLNRIGKRIFIEALNEKLYQKIMVENKNITYDALIRKNIYNLYHHVIYGEKFLPYKYR